MNFGKISKIAGSAAVGLHKSRGSIERFADILVLRESAPRTISKHLRLIRVLALYFNKTDISKLRRPQLEKFVMWLLRSKYTKGTREEIKMTVRLYYKLIGLGTHVSWIKARKQKSTLEATAILSQEEVNSMLNNANNPRDKALIALLYDTGIRPEELMGIRLSNVDLTSYPSHIFVNGKTGKRGVPLTFSVPYLAKYIDSAPELQNGYLWMRKASSHSVGRLSNVGLNNMLKTVAKNAGIKKKVYAYLFRHSAYTRDSKKYKEAILKLKYGWCRGSEMPEVYGHLNYNDLDKIVLGESNKDEQESIRQRLEQIENSQRLIISKLG